MRIYGRRNLGPPSSDDGMYPSWAQVVKARLSASGEDEVLRELYDMSCRGAKRFPRDFLERRSE